MDEVLEAARKRNEEALGDTDAPGVIGNVTRKVGEPTRVIVPQSPVTIIY